MSLSHLLPMLVRRWHRAARALVRLPERVHRDQEGTIGIASVFGLLLLVFLLGMVMNSGQQVDQKVKMQDAADAATYSGGVVLARGMNALAFTNHMIPDVFAVTAFMREARDRNAESLTPEILDHWDRIGPIFSQAQFEKFSKLGDAIGDKVPLEREMVRAYSEWAAAASEKILPVMEEILAGELIPEYQRALLVDIPVLAQVAVDETAKQHGQAWPRDGQLSGALWRTNAEAVGGASEQQRRTLPVVDPVMDSDSSQEYLDESREQRRELATRYLADWNNELLEAFDRYAKMSQFSTLWRTFTCGQLEKLLEEEYPNSNLLMMIRKPEGNSGSEYIEQDFLFVGVVYREKIKERVPGVFKNPIESSTQAYAEVMLYVPRRRLIWVRTSGEGQQANQGETIGGLPGQGVNLPAEGGGSDPAGGNSGGGDWIVGRQSGRYYPEGWDLLTQNWTTQMVPATAPRLAEILSNTPQVNGGGNVQPPDYNNVSPPDYRGLDSSDLPWLSHH